MGSCFMKRLLLRCIECGAEYSGDVVIYRCLRCDDLLDVVVDVDEVFRRESLRGRVESIWRYAELLPDFGDGVVSLGEGFTRLVKCERLAKIVGVRELFLKLEGLNPTGSFKDRGMSVGVSMALSVGARRVMCASTGNTSASLAAYSARAGLECVVLIPEGRVALGKLFQARIHGAKVYQVRGNFDEALSIAFRSASEMGAYLLNSINPWRLEGQKTVSFEIWEQLGRTDINVVVPVGNSGNISAIWKGFKELQQYGVIDDFPRLIGVQASGAAPIVEMLMNNYSTIRFWDSPETVATAIRIGKPVNWKKGIRAIRESDGTAVSVTDDEILKSLRLLATVEGVACEPAGASTIAGLKKLVDEGKIGRDEIAVCILTGNALKDPSEHLVSWNIPMTLDSVSAKSI